MIEKLKARINSSGFIEGTVSFVLYCLKTLVNVGGAKILHHVLGFKNTIVLKGQTDFGGSCRVLYEELIKHNLHDKYTIVWHIDEEKNRNKLVDGHAVVVSKSNWLKNIYYNATALYVFYEVSCCYQRRVKGQTVVYLGHGCPSLKNCKGYITLNNKLDTCAMITSENVRSIMSSMLSFPEDEFIVNGIPRNDVIVKSQCKFSDYGIRESLKVVIWMPTFRESNIVLNNVRRIDSETQYLYGLPLIHKESDLKEINERLASLNLLLLIKPHPCASNCSIDKLNYSNIKVWTNDFLSEQSIDMYSLFKDSAGLISDYSSVSFDYMLSNNPVGYIVDDLDSYKLGFAYANILDYMPGHHIKSIENLFEFFADISCGQDRYCQERKKINEWANTYNDGRNAERLLNIMGIN